MAASWVWRRLFGLHISNTTHRSINSAPRKSSMQSPQRICSTTRTLSLTTLPHYNHVTACCDVPLAAALDDKAPFLAIPNLAMKSETRIRHSQSTRRCQIRHRDPFSFHMGLALRSAEGKTMYCMPCWHNVSVCLTDECRSIVAFHKVSTHT